ncbi:hypothetical protein N7537_000765 [Penicillium hordei]|uniref:Bacteriophage T5 Orf172 DNA-binding domain-containing protein n=1 Tax=Penicillium hordei TaxID=40994 RepID=A0AAD6EET6_9EURO|nr:uncharacterized protein N7537_000765 [Penicillium hordei]KAJ5615651.1 hypothetical protein N7537_000765 [Penicillium hordei]
MMQSAMESPANVFIHLSSLLEIAYGPILRCVQLKDGADPCSNKIAGANLESVKGYFRQLFAILNEPDRKFHDKDGVFDEVLTELIDRCLCRRRHRQNSDDAKSQWLKELYNDEKRHQLRCKMQPYLFESLEEDSINSTPPPATEFELCNSKQAPIDKYDVQLNVTRELLKPLTEHDKKDGFIYLISHPREPKMFKVGHTIDLEARFSNHKRCYEEFCVLKKEYISYAHRIEQLIIAEFSLKHYKLKEKCKRCDRSHKEWLQVKQEKLVKSFNKWVKFTKAEKRPYDENGRFKSRTVALPSPAMDFKPPTPTPKKSTPRRSDVAPSQEASPSKPDPSKSDIRIIQELSEENSESAPRPSYSEADHSSPVSNLSARLAAACVG